MNLVTNEIPTAYAVELLSLGLDMQEAGIHRLPCRVPCIEAGGMLVPTMEGERGKYPMHPFGIEVVSDEATGGGFALLSPEPTKQNPLPRIGLPIYKPDEAERLAPYTFQMLVGSRIGFAALRSSFDIETVVTAGGRERYAGTTAMAGVLSDGSELALYPEPVAASFYVGLIKNVGTAKLAKLLAQQRDATTQSAESIKLALAV